MQNKKLSAANRKFFAKYKPYNFCDCNCKRCYVADECKIYQEKQQYQMESMLKGKIKCDGHLTPEEINSTLQQIIEILTQSLEDRGMQPSEELVEKFNKAQIKKDQLTEQNELYQKSQQLSLNVNAFLKSFEIPLNNIACITNSLQNEYQEIAYYGPMIYIKAARALNSRIEEQQLPKFPRPDSAVSAAIGFCSVLATEFSLRKIKNIINKQEMVWIMQIDTLLKEMEEVKQIYLESFPEVEKFKTKIIFNGVLAE